MDIIGAGDRDLVSAGFELADGADLAIPTAVDCPAFPDVDGVKSESHASVCVVNEISELEVRNRSGESQKRFWGFIAHSADASGLERLLGQCNLGWHRSAFLQRRG